MKQNEISISYFHKLKRLKQKESENKRIKMTELCRANFNLTNTFFHVLHFDTMSSKVFFAYNKP